MYNYAHKGGITRLRLLQMRLRTSRSAGSTTGVQFATTAIKAHKNTLNAIKARG